MPRRPSASTSDTISPSCEVIEVRVAELRQLFNAMDPSPFRERDLDPAAEEHIANWVAEVPSSAPLCLLVHLDRRAGIADEAALLGEAIQQFFRRKGEGARRRLRDLFRRGRTSLVIGLAFLIAVSWLAGALTGVSDGGAAGIVRESLIIGGWVAMWRPLEVFLYDWWPIRAEAKRYDRLAAMPVRISYAAEGRPDAWRGDWPTVPLATERSGDPRAFQR